MAHVQQPHALGDAGHAHAVVAASADRARDVGAVEVLVERVVVGGRSAGACAHEVEALPVVHLAVPVVVDVVVLPASARLAGVLEDLGRDIRELVVEAAVDHRDDHRVGAGGGVPCALGVDVHARDRSGQWEIGEVVDREEVGVLGDVAQPPQARELRIVRDGEVVADHVGRHERHPGLAAQLGDRFRHGLAVGHLHDLRAGEADRGQPAHAGVLARIRPLGRVRSRLVLHDHPPGDVVRRLGARGQQEQQAEQKGRASASRAPR